MRLTRSDFMKAAGAGAAGAALFGSSVAAGARYKSYLPEGGSRMNVILVIIDSLRRDHVGAYGNRWIKTPNLDALAKESLVFSRPYPESLPTICARRAIHTGTRTWPFRDWHPVKGDEFMPYGWQPVPEGQVMLSEILQKQGFYTSIITDTLHLFRASYDFQRGFDAFNYIRGNERDAYRPIMSADPERVRRNIVPGNDAHMREKVRQYVANTGFRKSEADWFSPMVFSSAATYLRQIRKSQPFFLLVDSFDVHEPWDPPQRYIDLYGDPDYRGPNPIVPNYSDASWLTDGQLERMRNLYAAEITMMDRWFGHFMNTAHDLGVLDDSILIVLSDHGVALGEHNDTGKPFWALWPEMTDTVFFIRHPEGKGAGERSDYYASTHDVAPTILSLLGIEIPSQMNGTDLSPILQGEEPRQRRTHFSLGYNNYAWTRDDRYVMFSTNTGSDPKLYDIREDPGMNHDIAGRHPSIVRRMFRDYILADAGGPLPNY